MRAGVSESPVEAFARTGGWGEATGAAPGTTPPKVGFQRRLADRARSEGVGVGSGGVKCALV